MPPWHSICSAALRRRPPGVRRASLRRRNRKHYLPPKSRSRPTRGRRRTARRLATQNRAISAHSGARGLKTCTLRTRWSREVSRGMVGRSARQDHVLSARDASARRDARTARRGARVPCFHQTRSPLGAAASRCQGGGIRRDSFRRRDRKNDLPTKSRSRDSRPTRGRWRTAQAVARPRLTPPRRAVARSRLTPAHGGIYTCIFGHVVSSRILT